MMRSRRAWIVACLLWAGCTTVDGPVDVTPPLTGSGVSSVAVDRLPSTRFEGTPTRIGFEPIPLEGGEFPLLTNFAFLPNSNEFLAVNRVGKVGHFRLEESRAVLLGSFQIPAVFTGGDCAASAIAIDPEFRANRLFYVGYCADAQYNVIKRYTMASPDFGDTLYTSVNVLVAGDPKADVPQHAIGSLEFGPDGVLWANMGERRRDNNAQDLTNELGKVIRFVPLRQAGLSGYGIAHGNAFPDQPPRSPLVFVYGLRNPWRGAFDAKGRYWVADVGSTQFEEINVITGPRQNFGWPVSEGPLCRTGSCAAFVPPVRYWNTSAAHPFILEDPLAKTNSRYRSSWVGIEYRPAADDPYGGLLTGKMLYGDFYIGFVRGIAMNKDGEITSDQHLGHIELPVAWRQGRDGYLYVGTMLSSFDREREGEGDANLLPQTQQGQLWRVVPLP